MSPPVLQKPRFFIESGFHFFYPYLSTLRYFCHSFRSMKFRTKIIFPLFLFILRFGIIPPFAQTIPATGQAPAVSKEDTASFPVDSTRFFTFSENGFPYGNTGRIKVIENKLDGVQQFHIRQAGLGNAGAAEKPLTFPGLPSTAFRRGINTFAYFGFLPENRRVRICPPGAG